jgi:uncharacterized protein YdiU (UPF0061 family)
MFRFDNSYQRLPDTLFARVAPTPVSAPSLLAFNDGLAAELGLGALPDNAAAIFAGNTLPEGSAPIAQLYAGHQFGNWNPQLGDGRAVLLGEVVAGGARHDIQLKGAGRTPYSRGGDGRAWLGPVIREYIVSEAMHALGVPTTRALAAVRTGDPVLREDGPMPGAVLTRTASSHIRVGTFQVLAARGMTEELQALTDHTIARHYPDAKGPLGLLTAVVEAQARLVAQWMGIGFIHGVMNTDNCAVSGETIDYGPCAFMDAYHPMMVFSSIDRGSRYAFGEQPQIAAWNCAQLATALLALMPDRDAAVADFTEAVNRFGDIFQPAWIETFGAKLGLADATPDDVPLIQDLLTLMAQDGADFTNTFATLDRDQFLERDAFDNWHARLQARAPGPRHTPQVIPRNHRIEAAIQAAVTGDDAPFHALLAAVTDPFTPHADFARPPTEGERVARTFCGT